MTGRPMSDTGCPVCLRQDRAEIEADLLAGKSQKAIASQRAIPERYVRHIWQHMQRATLEHATGGLTKEQAAEAWQTVADDIKMAREQLANMKPGDIPGAARKLMALVVADEHKLHQLERIGRTYGWMKDGDTTVNVNITNILAEFNMAPEQIRQALEAWQAAPLDEAEMAEQCRRFLAEHEVRQKVLDSVNGSGA